MGHCPLTPSELDVLRGLSEGLTIKQIAAKTGRTPATARTLTCTAYPKLGVHDRTQAVLMCERQGWLTVEAPSSKPSPFEPSEHVDPDYVSPECRLYTRLFVEGLRKPLGDTDHEDHLLDTARQIAGIPTHRHEQHRRQPTARTRQRDSARAMVHLLAHVLNR